MVPDEKLAVGRYARLIVFCNDTCCEVSHLMGVCVCEMLNGCSTCFDRRSIKEHQESVFNSQRHVSLFCFFLVLQSLFFHFFFFVLFSLTNKITPSCVSSPLFPRFPFMPSCINKLILMSLCFKYELLSFYPGESLLFKRGASINETNPC